MDAARPKRSDPAEIFGLQELWPLVSNRVRDNHYEFAHRDLRESVALNPGAFVAQGQREPEALRRRLHALWGLVTRRHDPEFCGDVHDADFYNEVLSLGEHTGLLVYMPPARNYTEALYVLVVLLHGEMRDESAEVSPFRYFTAELGTDDETPVVVACEWTSTRHSNLGVLDAPTVEHFLARISDIVTGSPA